VIAEMVTMLATESLVSCSPSRTLILPVDPPAVQWAAVRTCWLEIRDPPQKGLLPLEDTRPTCQGYSLTSVSCPPTILLPLFTWPQLHLEVEPVVVVGAAVVAEVPDEDDVVGASVLPVPPEPDTMHLKPFPVPHPNLEHEVTLIQINRPLLSDILSDKSKGNVKPSSFVPV